MSNVIEYEYEYVTGGPLKGGQPASKGGGGGRMLPPTPPERNPGNVLGNNIGRISKTKAKIKNPEIFFLVRSRATCTCKIKP